MEYYRQLKPINTSKTWATIGSFDGVHFGHQSLIKSMVDSANRNNAASTIITFFPHPAVVLQNIPMPFYLSTPQEKNSLFENLGIDYVISLEFDLEMAALSPDEFLSMILENIPVKQFWLGTDFTLGKGRTGTIPVLKNIGEDLGFNIHEFAHFTQDSKKISSRHIRTWINQGDILKVNQALGRPYSMTGLVQHGDSRGHTIGFPTANLSVWSGKLIPSSGVYATFATIEGTTYPSVSNIGFRPTFDENQTISHVETFIIDFNQNIYDHQLQLSFIERIRPEIRFANITALKNQISLDVNQAQEILQHASKTTGLSTRSSKSAT